MQQPSSSDVGAQEPSAPLVSSDRPTRSLDEDRYGLKQHIIPRLARLALEWPTQDGLVIGLFGAWGLGKTSILNMFRDYVENKHREKYAKVHIASFNPWFYEDTGALITSFFATIAQALGKEDGEWGSKAATALKAMGKFLTVASKGVSLFGLRFDGEEFSKATELAVKILDSGAGFSSSLAELRDEGHTKLDQYRGTVEKVLEELGKDKGRVVVLIDDVDRLNKHELLSLLRLVRTVADLPYVTLIVAMDDQRVRDVLKQAASDGYGQGYLDKIVQVPLHVPLPGRSEIVRELSDQLKVAFEQRGLDLPRELTPSQFGSEALSLLASLIRTPRDLKRYMNGVRMFLLAGDDPDVHPTDTALIEALRVFYPDVYDRIRRHKGFLTSLPAYDRVQNSSSRKNREQIQAEQAKELDLIVRGDAGPLETTTERSIRRLLELLFGRIDDLRIHDKHEITVERRVRSQKFFDNYFYCAPLPGVVTRSETNDIFAQIYEHAQAGRITNVADVLTASLSERNPDAAWQIIQDIGQKLKGFGPKLLEGVGEGAIDASGRLPQEIIMELLEQVLDRAVESRLRGHNNDWNADVNQDLPRRLLQKAICSQFIVGSYYLLEKKKWVLEKEERRKLISNWLSLVDKQLLDGAPWGGPDATEMPRIFMYALNMIAGLGEASPVSSDNFRSHIVEYVNRRPQHLPQALLMVAETPYGGIPMLLNSTKSSEQILVSLQDVFGDYKRLQPAYDEFRNSGGNAGEYAQLLEDFGRLLSL